MAAFYVYILRCKDRSLYTGWTTDVAKRVVQHNLGRGAKYTRGRLPVTLIYTEKFLSKEDAMRREYEIKLLSRAQKLKLLRSLHEA